MARMKSEIKQLRDELARIEREMARLDGERIGITRALQLFGEADDATLVEVEVTSRQRARGVKDAVIGAVSEAGPGGLTVSELIDNAQRNGTHLDRGTVSSLLSRLKRDGLFDMREGRYFLESQNRGEVRPH